MSTVPYKNAPKCISTSRARAISETTSACRASTPTSQAVLREYTIPADQCNTRPVGGAAHYTERSRPLECRHPCRSREGPDPPDLARTNQMLALIKRLLRWVLALTLIVVGLVLSIPGIPGPGLLIVLIGVFVLLPESRWLRKKYAALKRRFPRLFSPIESRRARARHARRGRSRRGS